jgi:hypothetical protein
VCDYWFVTKKPSSIALASLVNAIDLQGPWRVDPRYKIEFLTRVVDLGIDIASDEEILACYERLRQMYDAGGYTLTLEDDPAVPSAAAAAAAGGGEARDEDVQEPAGHQSPTGIVEHECKSDSESEPEHEPEPYWSEPELHQPEEHHEPETLGKPEPEYEPESESKSCKSEKGSKGNYDYEHGMVSSEPEPELEGGGAAANATLRPTVVRTVSPDAKKKKTDSAFVNDARKTPPEILSFDEKQHGRTTTSSSSSQTQGLDEPAKKKSNKRKKSDDDDEWTPQNRGGV